MIAVHARPIKTEGASIMGQEGGVVAQNQPCPSLHLLSVVHQCFAEQSGIQAHVQLQCMLVCAVPAHGD